MQSPVISPSDGVFLALKLHCYAVARVFCMVARWQISDTRYLSGSSVCFLFCRHKPSLLLLPLTGSPAPKRTLLVESDVDMSSHSKRHRVFDSSGSQTYKWLTSNNWTLQTVLVLRRRHTSPLRENIYFDFPEQILSIKDFKGSCQSWSLTWRFKTVCVSSGFGPSPVIEARHTISDE